jgi:hypothetical protein
MKIAEIFSLGGRGDDHGDSKRHYHHKGHHNSYYGGHNDGHYDRHNDDGLLGILGD